MVDTPKKMTEEELKIEIDRIIATWKLTDEQKGFMVARVKKLADLVDLRTVKHISRCYVNVEHSNFVYGTEYHYHPVATDKNGKLSLPAKDNEILPAVYGRSDIDFSSAIGGDFTYDVEPYKLVLKPDGRVLTGYAASSELKNALGVSSLSLEKLSDDAYQASYKRGIRGTSQFKFTKPEDMTLEDAGKIILSVTDNTKLKNKEFSIGLHRVEIKDDKGNYLYYVKQDGEWKKTIKDSDEWKNALVTKPKHKDHDHIKKLLSSWSTRSFTEKQHLKEKFERLADVIDINRVESVPKAYLTGKNANFLYKIDGNLYPAMFDNEGKLSLPGQNHAILPQVQDTDQIIDYNGSSATYKVEPDALQLDFDKEVFLANTDDINTLLDLQYSSINLKSKTDFDVTCQKDYKNKRQNKKAEHINFKFSKPEDMKAVDAADIIKNIIGVRDLKDTNFNIINANSVELELADKTKETYELQDKAWKKISQENEEQQQEQQEENNTEQKYSNVQDYMKNLGYEPVMRVEIGNNKLVTSDKDDNRYLHIKDEDGNWYDLTSHLGFENLKVVMPVENKEPSRIARLAGAKTIKTNIFVIQEETDGPRHLINTNKDGVYQNITKSLGINDAQKIEYLSEKAFSYKDKDGKYHIIQQNKDGKWVDLTKALNLDKVSKLSNVGISKTGQVESFKYILEGETKAKLADGTGRKWEPEYKEEKGVLEYKAAPLTSKATTNTTDKHQNTDHEPSSGGQEPSEEDQKKAELEAFNNKFGVQATEVIINEDDRIRYKDKNGNIIQGTKDENGIWKDASGNEIGKQTENNNSGTVNIGQSVTPDNQNSNTGDGNENTGGSGREEDDDYVEPSSIEGQVPEKYKNQYWNYIVAKMYVTKEGEEVTDADIEKATKDHIIFREEVEGQKEYFIYDKKKYRKKDNNAINNNDYSALDKYNGKIEDDGKGNITLYGPVDDNGKNIDPEYALMKATAKKFKEVEGRNAMRFGEGFIDNKTNQHNAMKACFEYDLKPIGNIPQKSAQEVKEALEAVETLVTDTNKAKYNKWKQKYFKALKSELRGNVSEDIKALFETQTQVNQNSEQQLQNTGGGQGDPDSQNNDDIQQSQESSQVNSENESGQSKPKTVIVTPPPVVEPSEDDKSEESATNENNNNGTGPAVIPEGGFDDSKLVEDEMWKNIHDVSQDPEIIAEDIQPLLGVESRTERSAISIQANMIITQNNQLSSQRDDLKDLFGPYSSSVKKNLSELAMQFTKHNLLADFIQDNQDNLDKVTSEDFKVDKETVNAMFADNYVRLGAELCASTTPETIEKFKEAIDKGQGVAAIRGLTNHVKDNKVRITASDEQYKAFVKAKGDDLKELEECVKSYVNGETREPYEASANIGSQVLSAEDIKKLQEANKGFNK